MKKEDLDNHYTYQEKCHGFYDPVEPVSSAIKGSSSTIDLKGCEVDMKMISAYKLHTFFPIQEAKSRMKAQGEEPTKGTRLSGWETG